jgi:hypothetical protein
VNATIGFILAQVGRRYADALAAEFQIPYARSMLRASYDETARYAWDMMTELRKETLKAQEIRAQVVKVKIAFVSAAIGALAAIATKGDSSRLDVYPDLLLIPAFAFVLFDLLAESYSFSIKRIGAYIRTHLEPAMGETPRLPKWESFIFNKEWTQPYSMIGNLGFTGMVVLVAFWAELTQLGQPLSLWPSLLRMVLLAFLAAGMVLDIMTFRNIREMRFCAPEPPVEKPPSDWRRFRGIFRRG